MSNNRESRIYQENVHLFLAIKRTGTAKDKRCIRSVIKHNEQDDLKIFEAKLKVIGGEWRIHRTVNARDVKKAYKIFMKNMIDYPEKASYIDSEWRTALLNKTCKATNYFMLDIDTQDEDKIIHINYLLSFIMPPNNIQKFKTPRGWHYITEKFDTREICKLDYVTLLRDGYVFVKEVNHEYKSLYTM